VTLGGLARTAYRTGRDVAAGYGRHAGSQLAAGISYRVLFSLVPLVALVVSILDLVLPSELRRDIVDWLLHAVPGTEIQSAVEKSVSHPGATAPLVGLIALAGLLWAASGMMASIRIAFRVIWELPGPTYARGKLRDLLLVALSAALILVAFGVSLGAQLVAEAGKTLSDAVGAGGGGRLVGTLAELGAGAFVAFLAFAVVYSVVPPVRIRFRLVWPSAALAAVTVEILIRGFAVYLARSSDLQRVYGPLAGVFAFLLLVYLVGTILLLGAELIVTRQDAAERTGGA
jgi:membrane protein